MLPQCVLSAPPHFEGSVIIPLARIYLPEGIRAVATGNG
jgi:hypothetical protein